VPVLLVFWAGQSLGAAIGLGAGSPAAEPRPISLQFQSAEQCGRCHQSIYKEWKQSWMANAYTNPVFQHEFVKWRKYAAANGQDAQSCLRCHAPVALMANDRATANKIGREGVTCSVCHKVAKVRQRSDTKYSLVMDPRAIVYGANNIDNISAHTVRQSHALTDSTLCAGCHLDIDNADIPLERTFQEWNNSVYAKNNTQCMDCHMPPVANSDNEIKRSPTKKNTHRSHLFPGGHSSSSLLKGAATVKILPVTDRSIIKVKVTNARVGHHFPTGGAHPAQLILQLVLKNKNDVEIHTDQRVYELVFINQKNRPADAREQVASTIDTTLKPLEARVETFRVAEMKQDVRVEAKLLYKLLPDSYRKYVPVDVFKKHYEPVSIDTDLLHYRSGRQNK